MCWLIALAKANETYIVISMNKVKVPLLVPVCDKKSFQPSMNFLREALKSKDVRNIGVTGRFGAGKSSFLKTFFDWYCPFWKRFFNRIVWISLGDYIQSRNGCGETSDKINLETEVLQQLLSSESPEDLPFSGMRRVYTPSWCKVLFLLIILLWIVLSCAILIYPNHSFLDAIKSKASIVGDLAWLKSDHVVNIIVLALPILLFILLGIFYRTFIRVTSTVRLSMKGVELELGNAKNDDFSKFLGEIIYFFQASRVRYVIFEDLDRCSDTSILAKLRNLNHLINQSRQISQIKKPIRFVYAIRDGVFPNVEERTKFFDYILPIVPRCTSYNARQFFMNQVRAISTTERISEYKKLVKIVSPYICDVRVINYICNEFVVCQQYLPLRFNKANLLGMLVIKALFPQEFEDMQKNVGFIQRLLKKKEEIIGLQIKQNMDKIVEVDPRAIDAEAKRENNRKRAHSVETIRRKSLSSLAERNELTVLDIKKLLGDHHSGDDAALLHSLIANEYLSENYAHYMSIFYEGSLTVADNDFLLAVYRHEALPANYTLTNIKSVIGELEIRYFSHTAILNVSLIKFLIQHQHDYRDQLVVLKDVFSAFGENKVDFVIDYCSLVSKDFAMPFLKWLISFRGDFADKIANSKNHAKDQVLAYYVELLKEQRAGGRKCFVTKVASGYFAGLRDKQLFADKFNLELPDLLWCCSRRNARTFHF